MTGYGVNGEAVVEPATVMIAGKNAALKEIDSIQVPEEKVNVDGLNMNFSTAVKIKELLPDGIILADSEDDTKALISVEIQELVTETIELPKGQISINEVPEGYSAEFVASTDTISLDITGLQDTLNNMDILQVTGAVNVKAYMEENEIKDPGKGIFMIPVTVTLPDGIIQKTPVTVSIKFKEIEE